MGIRDELVEDIYDIFFSGKKFKVHEDPEIYYYMALNFKFQYNFDKMVKYLLKAVKGGYGPAMCRLGEYYKTIGENETALKYYIMALDIDCELATGFLGLYFKARGDLDNAFKYYKLGVENKHKIATRLLGYYYETIEDFENMKKYYLMGIDFGDYSSADNLGQYYYNNGDLDNAKLYWDKGVQLGSLDSYLARYFQKIGDMEKELVYLRLGYRNGIYNTAYNLAIYYEHVGNRYDMVKYLEKGANYGCEHCCKKLIDIYPNDEIKYSLLSLKGGSMIAKDKLITMIERMNKEEITDFLKFVHAKFRIDFVTVLDNVLFAQFHKSIALKYWNYLKKENMIWVLKYIREFTKYIAFG